MRPLKRQGVSKHGSASRFRRHARRTKAANMQHGLARGGWRL